MPEPASFDKGTVAVWKARTGRCALLFTLLLAACAQQVPMLPEESGAPLPHASYRNAARDGGVVYRIVPEESLILVHVGRDGRMKNLGHDHAVGSVNVEGYVELGDDPAASRADLAFPVRNLIVDDTQHRAALGLDAGPSQSDIAGTYANMLKTLRPEAHAWITVNARIAGSETTSHALSVSVVMNGQAVEFLLPVEFSANESRITITGSAVITHSAFGLTPFQAAGGLLRVADQLEITYRFVGTALK
jgi:hypothetical protein